MSISKLLVSAAFVSAIGFAMPASAAVGNANAEQITAATSAKQFILARRGADDGANHDKNDDRGRGRDDGANHARNGADDGAAHNANDTRKGGEGANHARNGADDGAGHDAGDDRGRGRGRGRG